MVTAAAHTLGFQCGQPPALLLVQAAEEQVEAPIRAKALNFLYLGGSGQCLREKSRVQGSLFAFASNALFLRVLLEQA